MSHGRKMLNGVFLYQTILLRYLIVNRHDRIVGIDNELRESTIVFILNVVLLGTTLLMHLDNSNSPL